MVFRRIFNKKQRPARADPRVSVFFSRGLAASELWLFGEDELAERVLDLSDDEWADVLSLGAYYRDTSVPIPVTETKETNAHAMCFACMHHVEGGIRPLARARRRPMKSLPAHLAARRGEDPPHPFGIEENRSGSEDEST